jgi:hypothetical protein
MLITRPAIMFKDGEVFEGHSYGSVAQIAHKLGFYGEKVHGFVTTSGDFVLPDEAAKIAFENGQIPTEKDSLELEDIMPRTWEY